MNWEAPCLINWLHACLVSWWIGFLIDWFFVALSGSLSNSPTVWCQICCTGCVAWEAQHRIGQLVFFRDCDISKKSNEQMPEIQMWGFGQPKILSLCNRKRIVENFCVPLNWTHVEICLATWMCLETCLLHWGSLPWKHYALFTSSMQFCHLFILLCLSRGTLLQGGPKLL